MSVHNENNKAIVKPVSASQLLRIAINRRRRGRDVITKTAGNHNRNNDDNINKNKNVSSSSSSLVFLLQNPYFSLPFGITEIAGPAGVGKTQIGLSLCADCVQYDEHRKAVYIQLGGSSKFLHTASRRLQTMLQHRISTAVVVKEIVDTTARNNDIPRHRHHHSDQQQQQRQNDVHDCLTRILVRWICNSEELTELLTTSLGRLLHHHRTISLVVLDGIANLFRIIPEYDLSPSTQSSSQYHYNNPWHHRAVTFFQISKLCRELSSKFEVPFVIINECTSKIPNDTTITGGTLHRRMKQQTVVLEPALGLAWSQCVNCRFFVRRSGETTCSNSSSNNQQQEQQQQHESLSTATTTSTSNNNNNNNKAYRRILHCLKAPHISSESAKLEFTIDNSGVIPIIQRDS